MTAEQSIRHHQDIRHPIILIIIGEEKSSSVFDISTSAHQPCYPI